MLRVSRWIAQPFYIFTFAVVFVRSRIIAHSLGSAWRGGLCANTIRSQVAGDDEYASEQLLQNSGG